MCYELKQSNKPFKPALPPWLEVSDLKQQKPDSGVRSEDKGNKPLRPASPTGPEKSDPKQQEPDGKVSRENPPR